MHREQRGESRRERLCRHLRATFEAEDDARGLAFEKFNLRNRVRDDA